MKETKMGRKARKNSHIRYNAQRKADGKWDGKPKAHRSSGVATGCQAQFAFFQARVIKSHA